MNTFDTILFGNGLTLSILNEIEYSCKTELNEDERLLCNQNEYIAHLLSCPVDCYPYDGLLRICTYDTPSKHEINRIISAHKNAKEEFTQIDDLSGQTHIDYIRKNGFEAWGGLHCFDNESSFYKRNKELVYAINNYWFHLLRKNVLSKACSKAIIRNNADIVSGFENKLTLNFDNIIDGLCAVEHLHGSFVSDFMRWGDVFFLDFGDNSFEYPYLFGTNAYEKDCRIKRINKTKREDKYYDLDFFFNDTRYYGDLLIYGISFADSRLSVPSFFPKGETINSEVYHNCLDGHILKRLNWLQSSGRVNHITIASYQEKDVSHYQRLINDFDLDSEIVAGASIEYYTR